MGAGPVRHPHERSVCSRSGLAATKEQSAARANRDYHRCSTRQVAICQAAFEPPTARCTQTRPTGIDVGQRDHFGFPFTVQACKAADWSGAMLTRRFLTVREVADLVQVSKASVRHWIKLRQLRAIDLGREWRVIPRDLEAFLSTHETFHAASLPAGASGATATTPASSSEAPSAPQDGQSHSRCSPGRHPDADRRRGTGRAPKRGVGAR